MVQKYPDYARIYNALGMTYLELKQIEDAIKWFEKGIKVNSHYYALYCGLAIAYNIQGKSERAIKFS